MLIQIITVDRSKRPGLELEALAEQLRDRGHEVVIRRATAAPGYEGRSGDVNEIVQAIWENDRACFAHARSRQAPYTLVLEDDCELDAVAGLEIAEGFLRRHHGEVDMFFLGASPNCWWRRTSDPEVVRYSHVYWWHGVIFTTSFIDRWDGPRTWTEANDIHFSRLIARGAIRAFGLRRQVAFQKNRRSRLAERFLYGFPWGDGRRVALALAVAALAVWIALER